MIDWRRVTGLRAEIGPKDFDEIVPMFLEEVAEITGRFAAGPVMSDLEADLHSLKGAALNLGFSEFSALCSAGESMAARGQAEAVDIAAILSSFDASKHAFLVGLETGRAA